jgi:dihydroflavonol-4-reductase
MGGCSYATAMDIAAVSGASGFIGSAVVRKLLDAGRTVRALVEPGADTHNLDTLLREMPGAATRLTRITVDVCDIAAMTRALEGAAAFYHLAAIYKVWTPDPTAIWRVNMEGTTASLLAARAAGVRRTIYTSSIAAVGLHKDRRPADETTPFNLWEVANDYILTKHLSERIAVKFAEAGDPIVIVNPAFPFGPRDVAPTPTGKILLALLRGQVPGSGDGGFCAIDVDDVAAGHVAAENRGRVGERYILGDHNVSFRDFFALAAEVAGVKAPKLHIPNAVGLGVALGMETWARMVSHEEPRATYRGIRYIQEYAWFDPTKARRELGLPSRPLRESLERAVTWFRENGKA